MGHFGHRAIISVNIVGLLADAIYQISKLFILRLQIKHLFIFFPIKPTIPQIVNCSDVRYIPKSKAVRYTNNLHLVSQHI